MLDLPLESSADEVVLIMQSFSNSDFDNGRMRATTRTLMVGYGGFDSQAVPIPKLLG